MLLLSPVPSPAVHAIMGPYPTPPAITAVVSKLAFLTKDVTHSSRTLPSTPSWPPLSVTSTTEEPRAVPSIFVVRVTSGPLAAPAGNVRVTTPSPSAPTRRATAAFAILSFTTAAPLASRLPDTVKEATSCSPGPNSNSVGPTFKLGITSAVAPETLISSNKTV